VSGVGSGVVSEKIVYMFDFPGPDIRPDKTVHTIVLSGGRSDRPTDASVGTSAKQYHRVNSFSDRPADRRPADSPPDSPIPSKQGIITVSFVRCGNACAHQPSFLARWSFRLCRFHEILVSNVSLFEGSCKRLEQDVNLITNHIFAEII
jgi:hypothetical protein